MISWLFLGNLPIQGREGDQMRACRDMAAPVEIQASIVIGTHIALRLTVVQ
jgi:hypothetical protein